MLGLKSFRTAAVVISGIELAEKIKKKQFHMSKLGGHGNDAGDLASGPGCITGTTLHPQSKTHRIWLTSEFAPEPSRIRG
jgi:hypothetical protein